jgi:hypothetical protein
MIRSFKTKKCLSFIVFLILVISLFFGQPQFLLAASLGTAAASKPVSNSPDLSTVSPEATGLVIGGAGITQGMGLLRNFVYLTQDQVNAIKDNKSVDELGLGDFWMSPTLYSSYHNHGTPEYNYTLAEGINLKTALTALGADVTSSSVDIEAKGSDGYDAMVSDAFGKDGSRNYIAPDGTIGVSVDPALMFYAGVVATSNPDSGTELPTTTEAITNTNPRFIYGQKYVTESNNCLFVENTVKIRVGSDVPAFIVTKESTTKTISLSDIALLGIYRTSYSWDNSGTQVTQDTVGVPLNVLLDNLGINVSSDSYLVINVNAGSGTIISNRTISYSEISQCLVAYDVFENSQRITDCVQPLRIYCPGETQSSVLIENVLGVTVSRVPYSKGDVNGDSKVTINDVVMAVNFVLGKATPTENQLSAADCNNDGNVTINDVVMIVNKVLGN